MEARERPRQTAPLAEEDQQPLTIGVVRPGTSATGVRVIVRVRVTPDEDNRLLRIGVDSPEYFRSSDVSLSGADAARLHLLTLRELPTGQYSAFAILVDAGGGVDRVSQKFLVIAAPPE
jgi:hypothetical protein